MNRRSVPPWLSGLSATELLLQQLVESSRIRLALRGLHDLADEEAEQLVLARPIVGELPRVGSHDGLDSLLDRRLVGDLFQALLLDDRVGALVLLPHRLQHVLRDLAAD